MKENSANNTKCGNESCECKTSQKKETNLKSADLSKDISNDKKSDENLDPTHFGDWQVNCRTIDF